MTATRISSVCDPGLGRFIMIGGGVAALSTIKAAGKAWNLSGSEDVDRTSDEVVDQFR